MNFSVFRTWCTVALGAIVGALIALPLTLSGQGTQQLSFPILVLMGALIGYRKRASTFFFYLSLVAVIVLASLISYQMIFEK